MLGTIDIKVRPLRLAFLVDPESSSSLREAIQINSTLWGGTYNPIVPLYKRSPASWAVKPMRAPKAQEVVKGLLDAFDPDVLVQCSGRLPPCIATLGLEIIKPDRIWELFRQTKGMITPVYGIGVFELLNRIFAEHFRYLEKFPVKVVIPEIPKKLASFWAAFLGEYPKDIGRGVLEGYKQALDIEEVEVSTGTLKNLLQGNVLFPRRIAQFDLQVRGRRGFRKDNFLFFMDGAEGGDVIDYWNLRALGKLVLPIPKQLAGDPKLRNIATEFVRRAHRPYRDNPTIWNCASFVRGRHVTMDEMQAYAKTLDLKKGSEKEDPYYLLQHWYPRIWDEWGRDKDGAEPAVVCGEEKSFDLSESATSVQLRAVFPKAAIGSFGYGSPRCANEISLSVYGTDVTVAQVLPKMPGRNVVRALSPFALMPEYWRLARSGLVRLVEDDDRSEDLVIPQAQDVFFAWLKDLALNAELSPPGLIAKEILAQLGGFPHAFANEGLLKLIEHMNNGPANEREMPVAEVKSQLSQVGPAMHDYLVAKKVFNIGARVQCPSCRRNSWFGLDDIRDELACPKCLKKFSATGSLDQSTWCYRTAGPFSISGYADGAYCVLLSIDFLSGLKLHCSLTPSLSFIARGKGQRDLEADFGALWRDRIFGGGAEGALFGECKTFGRFETKDFKRMKHIAALFPGAVVAFCTLRKSLDKDEILRLTGMAKSGRRYWKADRPLNPVLILTGNELLSMFGPPTCWKDLGLSQKFDRVHSLLEICDATQQIYLKLPSWQETWREQWEGKQERRGERLRGATPSPHEPGPTGHDSPIPRQEV